MSQIAAAARSFLRDEEGATMVEYGLMLALIAVVCIVAITAVGNKTNAKFSATSTALT